MRPISRWRRSYCTGRSVRSIICNTAMPPARAGGIALFEGHSLQLEPSWVAHDVSPGGGHRIGPARTRFLQGDCVKASTVDRHPGMFGVRVDRDVATRSRFAI